MKYTDLTAVEDIGRREMSVIVGGGISFGEFISGRIGTYHEGFPHLPGVLGGMAETGTTNLGQLIQARSDQYGYPGINGIIAVRNDRGENPSINVRPGLPPGN